jgi:hypothetical protein
MPLCLNACDGTRCCHSVGGICLLVSLQKPLTVATRAGVAHASTEDDVYKGFFIPKGSVVFANAWFAVSSFSLSHVYANDRFRAILHNPEDYPEPDEFKPERYLKRGGDGEYEIDKSVRDPRAAVFGFGRRYVHPWGSSCPGLNARSITW